MMLPILSVNRSIILFEVEVCDKAFSGYLEPIDFVDGRLFLIRR